MEQTKVKPYKLTEVLTITIDGKPAENVYTSLLDACAYANIQYQTAIKYKDSNIITYINSKGSKIIIIKAQIVRQRKGRKKPFIKSNPITP